MRNVSLFAILAAYCLSIQLSLVGQTHPKPHVAPVSDQEVLLLFAGGTSRDHMLLTLNNNRPANLGVEMTLYTLDGVPLELPKVDMDASESRLLDFSKSLRDSHVNAPLGFLRLSYLGRRMELGAQLTLYPKDGVGGLDSPRSLNVDFVSTQREGVAWTPQGAHWTFAATNVTTKPVQIEIGADNVVAPVVIAPKQTILRAGFSEKNGDEKTTAFHVNYSGPVDAIRTFGFVTTARGTYPIRMYDPKGASSDTLSAVGLATKNKTYAFVRNVSGETITIAPEIYEVGRVNPSHKVLATINIPAFATKMLPLQQDLNTFLNRGSERTTLLVRGEKAKGKLVAAIDQEVGQDIYQDIPFRTPNPPRYMRGMYPLRWTEDYTNHPMIANTSSTTVPVRAFVTAGGMTYVFEEVSISPGQTAEFDVDRLRKQHVPDVNGKQIPESASFGKFHWAPSPSVKNGEGLHGRTELESLVNRRSSSFSCGATCEYSQWRYPDWDDTDPPFGDYPPSTADARESIASQTIIDTYGNQTTNHIYVGQYDPITSGDPSVLTLVQTDDYTLRSDTGDGEAGGGSTTVSYYWNWYTAYTSSSDDNDSNDCTEQQSGGPQEPDVSVQVPTATRILPGGLSSQNNFCPANTAGWDRTFVRIVTDQHQPIQDIMAYQQLHEIVGLYDDQLHPGTLTTNDTSTNPYSGQFNDTLRFCSSECPSSKTTKATQVISDKYNSGNYTLRASGFVYSCTGNSIDGTF